MSFKWHCLLSIAVALLYYSVNASFKKNSDKNYRKLSNNNGRLCVILINLNVDLMGNLL